jgi:Tfp pilus assembly protein PilF
MASGSSKPNNAGEIDRLALALAKEPGSKAFIPLAEEYGKAGMWQEAAGVLEDGLKAYPNFITAMVALGRTYDQLNQPVKAKAILEEAVKLSPENLRAHRTLAKIYVAQGLKEAALRSCGVILSVNAHDQEALALRDSVLPSPTVSPEQVSPDPLPQPPAMVLDALPAATWVERVSSSGVTENEDPPAVHTRARQAVIARLEAWLSTIQTRRRSREHPTILP